VSFLVDEPAEPDLIVKLLSCRVEESTGWDVEGSTGWESPPTGIWHLIFTRQALLLRGDHVITLEYPSIRSFELEEAPLAVSRKAVRAARLAGKGGTIFIVGSILGGDAGWSAARKAFPDADEHNIRITLTTAFSQAVFLHRCSEPVTRLKGRLPRALIMQESPTETNEDAHPYPVAEQVVELYEEVRRSGTVTLTVEDLLERLGEPDQTTEARARAQMMLANSGLTESPSLAAVGLRPTSRVTLRRLFMRRRRRRPA
jgi:hypothetical protein